MNKVIFMTPSEAIEHLRACGHTNYKICKMLSEPNRPVQDVQIRAYEENRAMTFRIAVKFYLLFDIIITRIFDYGRK